MNAVSVASAFIWAELLREPEVNFMSSDLLTPEEGDALQAERIAAAVNYKPQHAPQEYLDFIKARSCLKLDKNHPQQHWQRVFTLFTIPSQHVYGDSIEECLDKAIEKTERRIRGELDSKLVGLWGSDEVHEVDEGPHTMTNYDAVWDLPEGSTAQRQRTAGE